MACVAWRDRRLARFHEACGRRVEALSGSWWLASGMVDQKNDAPRRYFVDPQGHPVLIGLSLEETTEFEALDLSPAEPVSCAGDGRIQFMRRAGSSFMLSTRRLGGPGSRRAGRSKPPI